MRVKKDKDRRSPEMVRCTFRLEKAEADWICEMRCEPKPSTAAAQVVRLAIKQDMAQRRQEEARANESAAE